MKTFPSYVCSLDAVLKRYLSVIRTVVGNIRLHS
jgi:hypothetical protein